MQTLSVQYENLRQGVLSYFISSYLQLVPIKPRNDILYEFSLKIQLLKFKFGITKMKWKGFAVFDSTCYKIGSYYFHFAQIITGKKTIKEEEKIKILLYSVERRKYWDGDAINSEPFNA